jgi:UDP-N-acetylmuramoyl-tripeptide--D-alanyl-D-alanine ligase
VISRGPLWTSDVAAKATGGRASRPWTATGVAIDSRTLAGGELFVAIKGLAQDGHAYVAAALDRGAAAAVVSRVPPELAADAPLLVVEDTMTALWDLGRAARARTAACIVGVTGSVGKTSVKEVLKQVLARQAETSGNDGSLNNHWGLPLTLARIPETAVYGVVEMGMNHTGELAALSQLARPDVAVITNVAAVHIEHFPSVEAIADAKAEIFAGCDHRGVAVLPYDNPHFDRLRAAAERAGVDRVVGFGIGEGADVRLLAADVDADGASVHARIVDRDLVYRVSLPGQHWVVNSLCVLAAVQAAGADVAGAAADLAELQAAKGRGRQSTIRLSTGTFRLIDDSYNASPVSMAASFDVLGRLRPGPGGRRVAVLGDMLELGDAELAFHAGLAAPLADHGIDVVFTAGRRMRALFDALPSPMRGEHAADAAALAPIVAARIRPGDIVTVKGSAGSRMGRVVEALRALDLAQADAEPLHAEGVS